MLGLAEPIISLAPAVKQRSEALSLILPPLMVRAFNEGFWPQRRIRADGLAQVAPFIADIPLEFVQVLGEIENASGGAWGPIRPCLPSPNYPDSWAEERLGKGSQGPVPDLPWLDVDQALPFGGGGYGDELWLVLDYRPGANRPRVLVNELAMDGPRYGMAWRELAPTFEEFWQLMRLPSSSSPHSEKKV